jgi:hypothetical protein
LLTVLVPRRRAEDTEGGVRTAKESGARDDQRPNQQKAGGGADPADQAASLSCWIGEDRPGLLGLVKARTFMEFTEFGRRPWPQVAESFVPTMRLDHEASLGEWLRPQHENGGVSVNQ